MRVRGLGIASLILALMAVALLLHVAGHTALGRVVILEEGKCESPCKADVVFVLDTSNSMNDIVSGYPKIYYLRNALKAFINASCVTELWTVGIVTFNTSGSWPNYVPSIRNVTEGMVPISSEEVKEELNQLVNTLTAGGCTPLGYGIYNGTAMLWENVEEVLSKVRSGELELPNNSIYEYMVIVSDGVPNIPGNCEENGCDLARDHALEATNYFRSLFSDLASDLVNEGIYLNYSVIVVYTGEEATYYEWLRDNIADSIYNATAENLTETFYDIIYHFCGPMPPPPTPPVIEKVIEPSTVSTESPEFNLTITLRNVDNTTTFYNVNIVDNDMKGLFKVVDWSSEYEGVVNVSITVTDDMEVIVKADRIDPGGYVKVDIKGSVYGGTPYDIALNNTAFYNATTGPAGGGVYEGNSTSPIEYVTSFSIDKGVRVVWPTNSGTFEEVVAAPPGSILEYLINITIPIGETENITVSDEVPVEESIDPSSISIEEGPGISYSSATPSLTGNVLRVLITDVSNSYGGYSWIAVKYRASVSSGVSSGDELINNVTAYYVDYSGNTKDIGTDQAVVKVVEPGIDVVKELCPSGACFDITVSNPSSDWPLYNATLTDAVPPELSVSGVEVVSSSGVSGLTNESTGNLVKMVADRLDPGGYFKVRVWYLPNSLTPWGGTIVNVARANGSSVPEPYGKTYQDEDDASITYSVSVDTAKYVRVVEPSEVETGWVTAVEAPPGGLVEYLVNSTIPAGRADWFKVIDVLPEGLSPVSGGVYVSSSPGVTYSNVDVYVVGRNVTVVFEDISNSAQEGWAAVKIPAVVLNTTSMGDVLPDVATTYWPSGESATNYANVTVIEPYLTIDKSITPTVVYGDSPVANITITLSNTGNAYAYDASIVDVVPPGLVVTSVSYTWSGAEGIEDLSSGNSIHITVDKLSPGGYVEVVITTEVQGLPSGAEIVNVASYNASSMPGAVEYEKVYEGEDDASITYCMVLEVSKLHRVLEPYTTEYADFVTAPPGALVEALINVTIPSGCTGTLVIEDELPDWIIDVGGMYITFGPNLVYASYEGPTYNGTHVTAIVHELCNVGSGDSYLVLGFRMRVGVSMYVFSGLVLDDVVRVSYSKPPCEWVGEDVASIEVVEPELDVSKVPEAAIITPNSNLSFTIRVTNVGDVTAYNVVVEDPMPYFLVLLDVESPNASILETVWNSTYIRANVTVPLEPGSSIIINLLTNVNVSGVAVIYNNVTATGFSMPQQPAKGYSDYDVDQVIVLTFIGGRVSIAGVRPYIDVAAALIVMVTLAAVVAMLAFRQRLRR